MITRVCVALSALVLLAGCPRQELFVVLPNADGRAGAGEITISAGSSKAVLNQPFAAAETTRGRTEAVDVPPGDTLIIFKDAIGARPILPHHFSLYFLSGQDQLTPASVAVYHKVFDDIRSRRAYQIEVIGHTDTMGNRAYNQQLSLARARAIRDKLIADGVAATAISIAGRGQLDLLVPTAAGVDEPRNRRVEITVR
jgi:outer membrane protein OmpA-like peptidoglycan-associated protein